MSFAGFRGRDDRRRRPQLGLRLPSGIDATFDIYLFCVILLTVEARGSVGKAGRDKALVQKGMGSIQPFCKINFH